MRLKELKGGAQFLQIMILWKIVQWVLQPHQSSLRPDEAALVPMMIPWLLVQPEAEAGAAEAVPEAELLQDLRDLRDRAQRDLRCAGAKTWKMKGKKPDIRVEDSAGTSSPHHELNNRIQSLLQHHLPFHEHLILPHLEKNLLQILLLFRLFSPFASKDLL